MNSYSFVTRPLSVSLHYWIARHLLYLQYCRYLTQLPSLTALVNDIHRLPYYFLYISLALNNMASLELAGEDAISIKLLHQLSRTPYACSSLSPPLSSRPGNYVYRGILAQPFQAQDAATARSIIIKHSTDSVPRIFEELLLNSLSYHSSSTTTATAKPPRLYLYDRETNTQVLQDFSNTNSFKALLFSADAHILFPSSSTATIGRHLGVWLRSFHTWASASDQAALRAQMWQNDPMRKIKYLFTYDTVLKVLGNYPELLEGHEKTLSTIRDVIEKEFERPSIEEGDDYGLLHGDFWSGK